LERKGLGKKGIPASVFFKHNFHKINLLQKQTPAKYFLQFAVDEKTKTTFNHTVVARGGNVLPPFPIGFPSRIAPRAFNQFIHFSSRVEVFLGTKLTGKGVLPFQLRSLTLTL